jgi:hypothetical protein
MQLLAESRQIGRNKSRDESLKLCEKILHNALVAVSKRKHQSVLSVFVSARKLFGATEAEFATLSNKVHLQLKCCRPMTAPKWARDWALKNAQRNAVGKG